MPSARLHADQVDVDESLVRQLLVRQLPQLAHLSLRQLSTSGTDNVLFRLGDDLAVRMPMRPGAVDGLRKELRWLPVIGPHLSLQVPEIVAAGCPGDGYPFPWTVVRWLDGEDALTAEFRSLTDAALALGRFVRELQAIDGPIPRPGTNGFLRGLPVAGGDEGFRNALSECAGLIDVDAVRAVWDDALAAADWNGCPVWLHADLLPGNLLLREGRLVGVLDFGAMATGDPAYDLTPAWHVLDATSRTIFRDVVRADDATWRRSRGLVVAGGVGALSYYRHTNPAMVRTAERGIDQVLSEVD